MAIFTAGARLHDYGRGTVDEMFGKLAADGWDCTQLAYKKSVAGVSSYADVTPELIEQTITTAQKHHLAIAVLGTYVELAMNDESRLRHLADFKSQLAVCKALGAGCMGTETTNMAKQPAGTTRERAQYMLCKSLEEIMPEAERLGVTVAVEPVTYHSMNSPKATRRVLDSIQSPNLKVIFDASNLIHAGNVHDQARVWDEVGNLLGDKIVAVHFKGQGFRPDGSLFSTSLEESTTDMAGAFAMLRALPQALPVLREEAVPARAASDKAFMKGYFV